MMDKTILLQKQVRDNSEDLRSYLQDLAIWEEDMKRKESDLTSINNEPEVPLIRNKIIKTDENKDVKSEKGKSKSRISSYDYSAWDKFDVDAECEKVEIASEGKAETEEDEEPSEDYKTRLRDEAIYEKERGNRFVKVKKWDEAISCYTHAISCNPKDPIFFANRALCFLKKDNLHSAEADCTSALQLDSTYVKALQRRAAARVGLKQSKDAVEDLKRVLELEPHNSESKKELQKIEKLLGVKKEEPVTTPPLSIPPVKSSTIKIEPITTKILQKQDNSTNEFEIPWPTRIGCEKIKPVEKLPHQRSKKALHRIEIKESDNSDISINRKQTKLQEIENKNDDYNFDYKESNSLAQILSQNSSIDVDEIFKDIDVKTSENHPEIISNTFKIPEEQNDNLIENLVMDKSNNVVENKPLEKKSEKIIDNLENCVTNFTIPKSSVQFYKMWKMLKNNDDQKCLYLKNIQAIELPNIFRESLESDIFSDIISVLSKQFIKNNFNVYEYIKSLSNVRRFSALVLFMMEKDKIALRKIFEYCANKNEESKEDLEILRKKYEV